VNARDHSFVVVAYEASPFLADCIRSLAAQTSPSRILIATSTPCPEIDAVAREHGLRVLVNPERRGIAGDWNFALCATDARYVTLAHQDDVYAPNFLAETLHLFTDHEGAICFTGYQEIDDAGAPCSSKISRAKHLIEAATLGRRRVAGGLPLRLFLSFGNPLPCSSVTFDRSQLGGFAFSGDWASNLDWEAWWRLHGEGRVFLHAPERLVGRRHNQLTETSRLIRDGRRQSEDAQMFAKIWPRPLDRAIGSLYAGGYR
jgi:glycosyltransferase involved in cell wall biosynthesis